MEPSKYLFCVWCFLSILCGGSWAANILYMSTTPSPSHNIWDKTLAMALRDRGHVITYVTHSPEKSIDNFTTIVLEGIYEMYNEQLDIVGMNDNNIFETTKEILEWVYAVCEYDFQTKGVQKLLEHVRSNVKYDLIIWDINTGQCLFPIIEMLGFPPTLGTSPFGLPPFFSIPFGTDLYCSYKPLYSLPYSDEMTFMERATNYIVTMYLLFLRQYSYFPAQMELTRQFFGREISDFHEVEKNFSLLLANYDPIFDHPLPIPPAIVPVGGLHTKRAKALPADLKKYLDESKDGFILFSLGTNVRSDKLGIEKRQALLSAFAKLKQNVVWKFESEIEGLSKNVIVRKFLPQNDILAHPNIKLFLSHGGGLGTQEAMLHGVPIVGIPFFVDQHSNVKKMVKRKLGVKLTYQDLTEEKILSAIHEVLDNPIYTRNSQLVSKRYKDQTSNPLDRAVFWVEYVLRHQGAQHLKVAARDMPFYQTELLDIWAFILLIFVAVSWLLYKICRKSRKKSQLSQLKHKTQ